MNHQPVLEIIRGEIVESLHYGSIAVVDSQGRLLASWGDPEVVTFLRSSAKPFQALPLVETGAADLLGLTDREIALICASHSGTEEHLEVLAGLLAKAGAEEGDLGCGAHMPFDRDAAHRLREAGEDPAPRHHNCSGKHGGMLALSLFLEQPLKDYLEPAHPVQEMILQALSVMCGLRPEEVALGVDGCSAPNFAVPLRAAATAYARLANPAGLSDARAAACQRIYRAMTAHPRLVGGPDRFDTRLMAAMEGELVSKGGAEGYQAFGLPPGVLGKNLGGLPGLEDASDPSCDRGFPQHSGSEHPSAPSSRGFPRRSAWERSAARSSPACGVAIKIADGNLGRRAGAPVALEVLRQLGVVGRAILSGFEDLAAPRPVTNFRAVAVGELRTSFELDWRESSALASGA